MNLHEQCMVRTGGVLPASPRIDEPRERVAGHLGQADGGQTSKPTPEQGFAHGGGGAGVGER